MRLRYVIPAVALGLGTIAACGSGGSPTASASASAVSTVAGNCYARSTGATVVTTGATPAQCASFAKTLSGLFPADPPFKPVSSAAGTPVCRASTATVYAASAAYVPWAGTVCNMVNTLVTP